MRTVLIIGGGFCGVACAVHLLRAAAPVRVLLLEKRAGLGGLAYARCGAGHLLNVPADNMGVCGDDPESFLRFARGQVHTAPIAPSDHLPRRLYGDYLAARLASAARDAAPCASFERITGQAISLQPEGLMLRTTLADGRVLQADRVILATGHFDACDIPLADASFHADSRYQRDPWDSAQLASLKPFDPVLLLGSGLTAVDVALTLLAQGARRITMLSRHGLLPQRHDSRSSLGAGKTGRAFTQHGVMPGASTGRGTGVRTVRAWLRLFRQGDWREEMSRLRPQVAALWRAWPEAERSRFLRHVQPYWDSHRHRLPPPVHEQLQRALADERLRVVAGRLQSCAAEADVGRVRATLQQRGAGRMALNVARVINCTGNCPSAQRCSDPLVVQLVQAGALLPRRLGVEVAREWEGRLAYVGPWLKAAHWEATAVPELRKFAAEAAAWALT